MPDRSRYYFLDAVRGLAALQVILLHYVAAFYPAAARVAGAEHTSYDSWFSNSPLFFLIDGNIAVYLFFLMSGFVLTIAFSGSLSSLARQITGRCLRLYIPVFGSFALGIPSLVVWHSVREPLLAQTQSIWLGGLVSNPGGVWQVTRDIFADSMLLGYRGASIFGNHEGLSPIANAINPPAWSLHFEWWGSLLLIVFTRMTRQLDARSKSGLALSLILLIGANELSLFLVGFIFASWRGHLLAIKRPVWDYASFFLLFLGVYFCVLEPAPHLIAWSGFLPIVGLSEARSTTQLAGELGAILIFASILMSDRLRRPLEHRALQLLGKISFSLYLLHFPILLAVSTPIFLKLSLSMSYSNAVLLATAGGLSLTAIVAAGYYKGVDAVAVTMARSISKPPK